MNSHEHSGSEPTLQRHFDELAQCAARNQPTDVAAASLLVLRATIARESGEPIDGLGVPQLRRDVAAPDFDAYVGTALLELADALEQWDGRHFRTIAKPLYEFARRLEQVSLDNLARDAYDTILFGMRMADTEIVARALIRIGRSYVNMNDLTRAQAVMRDGQAVAARSGCRPAELLAVLMQSVVHSARGNHPAEERIIRDVLDRAMAPGYEEVRSRALDSMVAIEGRKGNFAAALRYGHDALACCPEPSQRFRITNNLAVTLLNARRFDDALALLRWAMEHTPEDWVRTLSLLNMAEIYSEQGKRAEFERCIGLAAKQRLWPELHAIFYASHGQGLVRFGMLEQGKQQLTLARAVAAEHGLNYLLLEAEKWLVMKEQPAAKPSTYVEDEALDESISAVRELVLS